MLKASSKSQFKKLVKNNVSTLGTQLPLRSITSNSVYLDRTIQEDNFKSTLDNYARYEKHIGIFKMNREHRYNTLTPKYIKDVKRFLTTLNQDDEVKIILMTPAKDEQFCHGTDFRTLLHYQQEKDHDKIVDYLKELYSLQTLTAKINKPIIGVAHGHALNSGATLLQATGIPTSTPNTLIAFNEVQFGFVPHGGTSFYMSRLPGELGTYLALTGLPMTGVDGRVLNLTDMYIHKSSKYKFLLADIMDNVEFPMPSGFMYADNRENIKEDWQKTQHMVNHFQPSEDKFLLQEAARRKHKNIYFSEFAEPRDRLPETVGEADMKYQMEMNKFDRSQDYNKGRNTGYFDGQKQYFQNYFSYLSGYVKRFTFFEYNEGGENLKRHIQAINRCFYANTLEEIIDNLQRENTPFAKKCLDQMNRNSTLSMKLTLKMVRQARNLCYKGCLQNEINVALNKIEDKEFDLGVKEVLMKPGTHGSSPKFNKNVSEDEVNSYFRPNRFTEAVELDIVEKALLPTRHYFEDWSDQVRLWVNEESTPQAEVRRHFDFELLQVLQSKGIDLRDRALDVPTARAYLYHQQQLDRLKEHVEQRMEQMATDTRLRESYYERVNEEIDQLEKQPKEFYQMVNNHIQSIFEDAYIDKLQTVYDKSKEIHNLEKRRMYLRFKQFLMSSRIITFADDKIEKLAARQLAMPFKEPHLSENWEQSFLLQQHPEIETSIIHHISKVVGKRTLAPLEIAKSYLSDPKLAKDLTVYTFDKEELEKLRRDILENPKKYEMMLTQDASSTYSEFPNRWKPQEIKDAAWIYWYQILNDGKTPFDNVHLYKTYEVYKEFVSNIEKKALSTLELVVTRLLQDFEDVEGFNKVVEFAPKEKETKRRELQRLMGLLTDVQPAKERKLVRSPKNESGELIKTTRSLDDVKRLVQNIVNEDQHLKLLIPREEEIGASTSNPMIQQLRQDLLDKLYTHLEFVLLNQHNNYPVSKKVLEERLAAITNPQNKEQGRLAKLGVIDQFLSDHNAEQTIKQALQLTKTFFLHEASAIVEDLGRKIMEAFRVDVLTGQYLMMYTAFTNHSEAINSPLVQRILNYHSDRDRERYTQQLFPTMSRSFYAKNLIHHLGDNLYDKKIANVSQKEAMLDKTVKERVKGMQDYQKTLNDAEDQYIDDINRYNDLQMKTEMNEERVKTEINRDPQMGLQDFTPAEIIQLQAYDEAIGDSCFDLELNIDKLVEEMDTSQWLNILWSLQTQHGIDCKSLYRYAFPQYMLDTMDIEGDLKEMMGRQDATFESVAELAGYAKQVIESFKKDLDSQDNRHNLEAVFNFYLEQTKLYGDELSQQSIFEKLSQANRAYSETVPGLEEESTESFTQQGKLKKLREEILNFKNVQEIANLKQQYRQNIEKLITKAPAKAQKNVRALLDSNSPYIDLEKLQNCLHTRKYDQLSKPSSFIDKQLFQRDLHSKDLFNKLMQDYKLVNCDVVSLALARETVAQTQTKKDQQSPVKLDDKLKHQIIHVLDYISDQCQHIPNDRRRQISIGEFLKRHQFLNSGNSLSDVANQIVREKIEQSLGKQSADAEQIEWEYAGYVTNPFSHALKNRQVQEAAQEGQSLDDNQGIENKINTEYNTPEMMDFIEYKTRIIDEITGVQHFDETQRILLDEVLLDAYHLVKIKEEFGHIKEKYRSELLNAYTHSDFTDTDVADIINEYTELRFKDLMLNSKFREVIKGPYATYYLRMLREEIATELDINEEVEHAVELNHDRFQKPQKMLFDAESTHNISDLSNTDAIGFDNIEQRSANPDQNRKLAHQTLFDELLSEYFLQKRQQVVNINELMDKLAEKFHSDNDHKLGYQPHEAGATKDPLHKKHHLTQFELVNDQAVPLAYSKLVQNMNKFDKPQIHATSFTDVMDLDIATAKALEKNKNGLSTQMAYHDLQDDLSIPEYLPMFDVRRPPKEYVDHKLRSILDDVFESRKRLEKTFTRNELYAYDKVLIKHLTLENLIPRIRTQVSEDKQIITVHGQNVEAEREGIMNEFKQASKSENHQKDQNEGIRNEDALYKFLAYTAMLEKTRKEKIKKVKNDEKEAFELNMFDEYYKKELLSDAKRDPRKINEEDFYEHKNIPVEAISEGYVPIKERQSVYFAEFQKYKENKKEGYDRNKMFYILEQYFNKTQEEQAKGNPMNDAQKAITDYFASKENTEFFMRNKIQ